MPTPAAAPAQATVRLDAFQAGPQSGAPGNGMGQAFNNAIDGFSVRASQMQASMRDLAVRESAQAPASRENLSLSPTAASAEVGAANPAMQSPMALMVDSFNFAIEASLVSRAATQFTGAVSTLMKGQ